MLPPTLLPTAESGTFLDGLDAGYTPDSAGDSANPLDSAFARILGGEGAAESSAALLPGDALPADGNALPVLTDAVEPTPVDPEEIAASLKEQIARLMPSDGAPADAGSGPGPTTDELTMDTMLMASDTKAPSLTPDQADAERLGPMIEGLRTDRLPTPAEPFEVSTPPVIDSKTEIPAPPAAPTVELTQAAGLRDAPRGPTAGANRRAADLPVTNMKQPSIPLGEPAVPLADSQAAEFKNLPVLTNPVTTGMPENLIIEEAGSPRLILTDVAASGGQRPVSASAPVTTPIAVPVQDPAWDQVVSERVVMMATNKVQTAEIRLTPAELGPLRIQVSMDDGSAQVSFVAQHAVTRDALEQALPRLRDMFAESGIALGDARVDVDTTDARERQAERDSSAAIERSIADEGDVEADSTLSAPIREQRGLVDTFV